MNMLPALMALAMVGQATPMAAPTPHWFSIDRPNGGNTYLWGVKDERGYVRGYIPPAGSPELATVPRAAPAPTAAKNFGVDLGHRHPLHPSTGEVRGTDNELGRELARSLVPKVGQRCPGPCPPMPRKPEPEPEPPAMPEAPGLDPMPLMVAGGLGLLTLAVSAIFLLVLLTKGRRP